MKKSPAKRAAYRIIHAEYLRRCEAQPGFRLPTSRARLIRGLGISRAKEFIKQRATQDVIERHLRTADPLARAYYQALTGDFYPPKADRRYLVDMLIILMVLKPQPQNKIFNSMQAEARKLLRAELDKQKIKGDDQRDILAILEGAPTGEAVRKRGQDRRKQPSYGRKYRRK
jgi:hypothetical protein